MSYLLGIDVGTSGTRAIVIDARGAVVRSAHDEYGVEHGVRPASSSHVSRGMLANGRRSARSRGDVGVSAGAVSGWAAGAPGHAGSASMVGAVIGRRIAPGPVRWLRSQPVQLTTALRAGLIGRAPGPGAAG